MKKTTIKVAELATIFYAMLVVMSLIIDDTFYSQFHIRIVSYMSVSEILLSCINQVTDTLWVLLIMLMGCVYMGIYAMFVYKVPLFQNRKSINAQYSVVAWYNLAAALIPIFVYLSTPSAVRSSFFNLPWQAVCMIITFYVCFLLFLSYVPSVLKNCRIKRDWTNHPLRAQLYRKDPIRKHICDERFSTNEKRATRFLYRHRVSWILFIFMVSLFIVQLMGQYNRAKSIKEKGSSICVVLEGEQIQVDTREGNIDYIGECADYIFLYNRLTQGTMIYKRKDIRHYLLMADFAAKASVNYDKQAALPKIGKLILPEIISQMDTCKAMDADFSIVIPAYYQLLMNDDNHHVWYDSLSHTCIEQVFLRKDLFEDMPEDNQIFDLTVYAKEDKDDSDNSGLCCTKRRTYTGSGGEKVCTMVGDGRHYTAWIFYDPVGQNETLGEEIFESVRLDGNIWHQLASIYIANKVGWTIVLVIFGLLYLIYLLAGLSSAKEDKIFTWRGLYLCIIAYGAFIILPLFYVLCSLWIGSAHRGVVLLTISLLHIAISCFQIFVGYGIFGRWLLMGRTTEQTPPETEEEHKEEQTEEK